MGSTFTENNPRNSEARLVPRPGMPNETTGFMVTQPRRFVKDEVLDSRNRLRLFCGADSPATIRSQPFGTGSGGGNSILPHVAAISSSSSPSLITSAGSDKITVAPEADAGGGTNNYQVRLPDGPERQVRGVELFSFRLPRTQDNVRDGQSFSLLEYYDLRDGLDTVQLSAGQAVRLPHVLTPYFDCLPLPEEPGDRWILRFEAPAVRYVSSAGPQQPCLPEQCPFLVGQTLFLQPHYTPQLFDVFSSCSSSSSSSSSSSATTTSQAQQQQQQQQQLLVFAFVVLEVLQPNLIKITFSPNASANRILLANSAAQRLGAPVNSLPNGAFATTVPFAEFYQCLGQKLGQQISATGLCAGSGGGGSAAVTVLPVENGPATFQPVNVGGTILMVPPATPQELVELTNACIERLQAAWSLPRVLYDPVTFLFKFIHTISLRQPPQQQQQMLPNVRATEIHPRPYLIHPDEFVIIHVPSQNLNRRTAAGVLNNLVNPIWITESNRRFQILVEARAAGAVENPFTPGKAVCPPSVSPELGIAAASVAGVEPAVYNICVPCGEYTAGTLEWVTNQQLAAAGAPVRASYDPRSCRFSFFLDDLQVQESENNMGAENEAEKREMQGPSVFSLLWSGGVAGGGGRGPGSKDNKGSNNSNCSALPLLNPWGFLSDEKYREATCFEGEPLVANGGCETSNRLTNYYNLALGGTRRDTNRWIVQQTVPKSTVVERIALQNGLLFLQVRPGCCLTAGNLVWLLGQLFRILRVENSTTTSASSSSSSSSSFGADERNTTSTTTTILTVAWNGPGSGVSTPVSAAALPTKQRATAVKLQGYSRGQFQLAFFGAHQSDLCRLLGFAQPFRALGSSTYTSFCMPVFSGVPFVMVRFVEIPGVLWHQFSRDQNAQQFFVRLETDTNDDCDDFEPSASHYFQPLLLPNRIREDQIVGVAPNLDLITVQLFNPDGTLYNTRGVDHSFVLRLYIEK